MLPAQNRAGFVKFHVPTPPDWASRTKRRARHAGVGRRPSAAASARARGARGERQIDARLRSWASGQGAVPGGDSLVSGGGLGHPHPGRDAGPQVRYTAGAKRALSGAPPLSHAGPRGVHCLDNHEDDRAMARLLDELRDAHASWVITARRCLLSGVSIFPVTAPLVTSGKSAFPRVAPLTGLLRFNPLALDIADALVSSGEIAVRELAAWLVERGVDRVRAIDHEDDLPEVALLVDWAWPRVGRRAQAMMVVLSQMSGDHMDRASLLELSRSRANGSVGNEGLERLRRLHLVQEPFAERYALHAVVRHAVRKRTLDAMGTNERSDSHHRSLPGAPRALPRAVRFGADAPLRCHGFRSHQLEPGSRATHRSPTRDPQRLSRVTR